jgi:nucleoside 2-deoxyribosyltransferase
VRHSIRKIDNLGRDRGADQGYLPYSLIPAEDIDLFGENAKLEFFHQCKSHIHDADVVIALLDGTQVPDDTTWEIACFYLGKSD